MLSTAGSHSFVAAAAAAASADESAAALQEFEQDENKLLRLPADDGEQDGQQAGSSSGSSRRQQGAATFVDMEPKLLVQYILAQELPSCEEIRVSSVMSMMTKHKNWRSFGASSLSFGAVL